MIAGLMFEIKPRHDVGAIGGLEGIAEVNLAVEDVLGVHLRVVDPRFWWFGSRAR